MDARTNEIEDENTDRNKSVGRRKIQGKLL